MMWYKHTLARTRFAVGWVCSRLGRNKAMAQFIVRRIFWMLVVLLAVSAITFMLMHAVPGGPFDKEKPVPPSVLENLNERYHLDDPLIIQYFRYVNNILVPHLSSTPPGTSLEDDHLVHIQVADHTWLKWMNFGPTYASRSRTVNDIFRQQLPVSIQLGSLALLIALLVGIPLGTIAALKQNAWADYLGMGIAIFGVSVPVIVLGPLLIWVFGIALGWLPPTGWGARPPFLLGILPSRLDANFFRHAIMPAVALGLGSSAIIARLTRASLLQVTREDYIRVARAKGLSNGRVIVRHAMRNSLIPVVTVLGPMFAALVTGTFVTELIFGIPGMGRYFVTSITNRDYPVIMGTILLYAIILVLANLVVDILYAVLDPRIRYD
jgi:ABC-type dipeptide/oligopeptide/nickel transport system permease component